MKIGTYSGESMDAAFGGCQSTGGGADSITLALNNFRTRLKPEGGRETDEGESLEI